MKPLEVTDSTGAGCTPDLAGKIERQAASAHNSRCRTRTKRIYSGLARHCAGYPESSPGARGAARLFFRIFVTRRA